MGNRIQFLALVLVLSAQASYCIPRAEGHSSPDDSASTLAFVFDVTGSMYDDLKQVIDGASRILEKTLNRRTRPIRNFVLVPFHDPDIGPVSITTDPKKFQRDLQDLFVQGGGDCPEMSVGAIKRALEVSLPGSFIYVFTDARAKDYRLKRDVLQLVQLRQSQVVFVLTGDCGDRTQPGYRAYEEIAATSSGQIFHLDKQQVNEVLKWVEETVQAMKVHLLSSDHEHAQEHTWDLPLDPSLKEVTVSLSGPAPTIQLTDPLGQIVGEHQGLTELLNIPNSARVVNLKNPRPGAWTLKVGCAGRHTLRVTGVSNLDFRAGFSSVPVAHFNQTRERPIKGLPTHVLLKCTGLSPPGLISRMELVSTGGRPLRTLPVALPPDGGSRGLWGVPEFRSPSQSFFMKACGHDANGFPFQRLSSVSYTHIIPVPPAVSMPPVVRGFYLQPVELVCVVESDVPVRLTFARDGHTLRQDTHLQSSGKAWWEIPSASGRDEGFYECVAHSSAGTGRAVTQLIVREPPPVLRAAVNVSVPVGGAAVLRCEVEGSMRYNLTWLRSGRVLAQRPGRIRQRPDGSLEIGAVATQDAGPYQCVATNTHGDSRNTVWLLVPEAPRVVVQPPSQSFTLGSEVTLSCSASGAPPPKISWTHGHTPITSSYRMGVSEHGTLTIRHAAAEDSGNYTCIATNDAGTASQSSYLTFAEKPRVSAVRSPVQVESGGDATLQCSASGNPPPLIHWYKGDLDLGEVVFAEQDVERGVLRIRGVQELDAGQYTCVASNDAGTTSAHLTLEVGVAPQFSESPLDVSVDVGDNVTLLCGARGVPVPMVTWRRADGRVLPTKPSGSLGNDLQLASRALHIQKPPLLAQVAPVITTVIGQSLTIPCMLLDGVPLPERVWTHNGKEVDVSSRVFLRSDGSLHVEKATAEDSGIYVCTAINVAGSANISVSLEVHVPPEINPGPLHYIANEGAAISLSCIATGVPTPTLRWAKGRGPMPPQASPLHWDHEGQLHLPNPRVEDAGVYVCTASSPAGYASREVQLTVNTKPKIAGADERQKPVKMAAEVGSEVILPCEVEGSPPPQVTWSRNGHPIPPVTAWFSVLPSGSLKISDVRVIDSKHYTCSAANPAGNVSLTYSLQVQAKPRIQVGPSVLKAVIGQAVVLPCVVQGEPRPEVTWYHEGRALPHERTHTHTIAAVTHAHRGTYRCVAKNSAGEESIHTTLEVLEAPHFEENGEVIIERVAHSPVTIPCPARAQRKKNNQPQGLSTQETWAAPRRRHGPHIAGDMGLTMQETWAAHCRRHGPHHAGDMGLTAQQTWASPCRRHGPYHAGDMAITTQDTWDSPLRRHGPHHVGDMGLTMQETWDSQRKKHGPHCAADMGLTAQENRASARRRDRPLHAGHTGFSTQET
ncbi:hypothetical protein ACEWY4_012453 [Coilia grayii]|uniref:Ig-like domain-containing protein n=1 Tax=Coilia grayii TaxID=363190 RepID=A0ABD1K0N6_9TELE